MLDIDTVYRFLDKLNNKLKSKVEQIAFTHTKKILNDSISVVCHDLTTLYKELERILYKEKSTLSLKKAAEVTHNMYEISYSLPESKHTKTKFLKMDDEQAHLYQIIQKNY